MSSSSSQVRGADHQQPQHSEDKEEENVFKIQTLKRHKVDEEDKCRTEGHPAFFSEMCVRCGQYVKDDKSAVPFGYIHKDLKIGYEELGRLRASDLKSLLRSKKLHLVLDLDHTLLNSTRLIDVSPDEEYLKAQVDSLSLFRLDAMHMMTKLRPFVWTFLKEASSMYEMHVYTMGERAYALQMAQLLDPERVYFSNRVVSQADCTQKHKKGLDVVLGAESAVVILDDTERVWSKHKENLIVMERYHFFASSLRQFRFKCTSLSESRRDENETEGALANILRVLKRIHQMFFDSELEDLTRRDVRQVMKTVRQQVLKGCRLIFMGEIAENRKLWEMAVLLGATCTANYDSSVTHVVSMDAGIDKSKAALKDNMFLVHPRWVEAANFFWKRQPEEQFPVT